MYPLPLFALVSTQGVCLTYPPPSFALVLTPEASYALVRPRFDARRMPEASATLVHPVFDSGRMPDSSTPSYAFASMIHHDKGAEEGTLLICIVSLLAVCILSTQVILI